MSAAAVSVSVTPTTGAAADPNEEAMTVSVTVDPGSVPPGVYDGAVRVAAVGGEAVILPVTITLKNGNPLGVFAIIALGSIFGIGVKWLSDTGATLNQANERYLRLIAQINGPFVPFPARSQLTQAQMAIGQLDATAATSTLDQLEKNLRTILQQMALLTDMDSELSAQSTLSQTEGVSQAAEVLARERKLLDQRLRETRPDDPGSADQLTTDLSQFAGFSTLLRTYPTATAVQQANLRKAADLYLGGDFAGGLKEVQATFALLGAGFEAESAPAPPGGAPSPIVPREAGKGGAQKLGDQIRRAWSSMLHCLSLLIAQLGVLVVRYQPWLSAIVVALLTALIGVQVLYYANPIYGANGIDNLIAFGWGFGLQLAGTTLAQIGGSLAGRGPKLT
jgi:hypothetical protein